MTETIAVMFIFFVLLFFGMIFYYRYVDASIEGKMDENAQRRAIEIATRFIFLPEVQCSGSKTYCIDLLKLEAFQKVIADDQHVDDYYYNLFAFAKITVQEVYPNTQQSWVVYDKPKQKFTSQKSTYFSVALHDPRTQEYRFGYVKMEVYS